VSWLAIIGVGIKALLRMVQPKAFIFLGLILIITVVGVSLTQSMMTEVVEYVSHSISGRFESVSSIKSAFVLKLGHAFMFGVLCLFMLIIRQRLKLGVLDVVLFCLIFAFATESLQRHQYTRSAQFIDIVIDCLGIALVLACWAIFTGFGHIKKQERED